MIEKLQSSNSKFSEFLEECLQKPELKGLPLDSNDLWIAATAMLLDAVLVTRDADFHQVDRLRTEDWTV